MAARREAAQQAQRVREGEEAAAALEADARAARDQAALAKAELDRLADASISLASNWRSLIKYSVVNREFCWHACSGAVLGASPSQLHRAFWQCEGNLPCPRHAAHGVNTCNRREMRRRERNEKEVAEARARAEALAQEVKERQQEAFLAEQRMQRMDIIAKEQRVRPASPALALWL